VCAKVSASGVASGKVLSAAVTGTNAGQWC